MEDSQHLFILGQSVIIGLIFSFLLAKLISILVSFRKQNLSIVRHESVESESELADSTTGSSIGDSDTSGGLKEPFINDGNRDAEGKSDDYEEEDDDDSDDWEGEEVTELDDEFVAASAFVASAAASADASAVNSFKKVSDENKLQLYGLYKIATEGPCKVPQPSHFKMKDRAKWQAWNKLGEMPTEEAMEKYIALVNKIYPSWDMGAYSRGVPMEKTSTPNRDGSRGLMGPVFSSHCNVEDPQNETEMDAVHDFARDGELDNLLKCFEDGDSVNLKDGEGRTPLHWAVDRGHLNIVELLISKDADVNAQDNEGQSALHYAAMCEREDIAEYMIKHKADIHLKDNEGNSPADLSESKWPFLLPSPP